MTVILDLSFDVLSLIFRELKLKDVTTLRLVCKRLLEATEERSVYAFALRVNRSIRPSAVRRNALSSIEQMSFKELKRESLHSNALAAKWEASLCTPKSVESYPCPRDTEKIYHVPLGEGPSQWYFSLTKGGSLRLGTFDGKKEGLVKDPLYKWATEAFLELFTTSSYQSLVKWETRYLTTDGMIMITTSIYRYWFDKHEHPHMESMRKISFESDPEVLWGGCWPSGDVIAIPWKVKGRMIISIYVIDPTHLFPPPEVLSGGLVPAGRLVPDDELRPSSVEDDHDSAAIHIGPEWDLESAKILTLSWTHILILNSRGMMIFPISNFTKKPKVSRQATAPSWRRKCDLGISFNVSKIFWELDGRTQRHVRPIIITVPEVGVYVLRPSYPDLVNSKVEFIVDKAPKPLLRQGIHRAVWHGLDNQFVLATYPGHDVDSPMTLGRMKGLPRHLFEFEQDVAFDEQSGRMLVLMDGIMGRRILVVNLV